LFNARETGITSRIRLCSNANPDGIIEDSTQQTEKKTRTTKFKLRSSYPRIYTRTGDTGKSSLFSGERRLKTDAIFEALGATDELSSHLGLAMEYATENHHEYVDLLERVQCILQDVGSAIATPKSSARQVHLDRTNFSPKLTSELEEWIDEYSANLPPLENFILPGGGKTAAALHVARAVCRRAERCIVPLVKSDELEGETLKYLNRLSDFLFVLARQASRLDNKEENIYIRPAL